MTTDAAVEQWLNDHYEESRRASDVDLTCTDPSVNERVASIFEGEVAE